MTEAQAMDTMASHVAQAAVQGPAKDFRSDQAGARVIRTEGP
jgi:hypothetical protein